MNRQDSLGGDTEVRPAAAISHTTEYDDKSTIISDKTLKKVDDGMTTVTMKAKTKAKAKYKAKIKSQANRGQAKAKLN